MTRFVLALSFVLASCVVRDHAPVGGRSVKETLQAQHVYQLRGLRAVRVLVFGPSRMNFPYTDRSVEDEIVERMKKAGIEVEQVTKDRTVPNVVTEVVNGYALPYWVEMKVTERAMLLRDPSHEVKAITWNEFEQVGTSSEVRDVMLRMADQFIADFKLANP